MVNYNKTKMVTINPRGAKGFFLRGRDTKRRQMSQQRETRISNTDSAYRQSEQKRLAQMKREYELSRRQSEKDAIRQVRERRKKYRNELKQYEESYKERVAKAQVGQLRRFERYDSTRSGKFSKRIQKGLSVISSPTNYLYRRDAPIQAKPFIYAERSNGRRRSAIGAYTGRRGRPVGTVKYKDASGNPIDVYTYRKLLAAQIRQQRVAEFNARAVTPQQRMVLEDFRRRELMARQNPERNIIPSTSGFVPINSILNEADEASHLFD